MANTTDLLRIPIPDENKPNWAQAFKTFSNGVDAFLYGTVEDRNLLSLFGGGTVSFTTDTLSWSSAIFIISPYTGNRQNIAAGSIQLNDGEVAFVQITRNAQSTVALTLQKASVLSSLRLDSVFEICRRIGSSVFFRNGKVIGDGDSGLLLSGSSLDAPGITFAAPVSTGTTNTQGVATTFVRSDHIHRTLINFQLNGETFSTRPQLNFIGFDVVDNPGNDRCDVSLPDSISPKTISDTFTSGVSLTENTLVRSENAAGISKLQKAQANTLTNAVCIGITTNTIVGIDGSVSVIFAGHVDVADAAFTSLPAVTDVGKKVFLSETAGKLTLTAPTTIGSVVLKIGILTRGGTGNCRVCVQIGEMIQV